MKKLVLAVVVALCFFGVQGAYAACAIGTVNCNENTNTNTATNGSVTDNSKTTNTNTAFGGTAISGSNSSANNDGNVKNSGNSSINHSGNSTNNIKTSTNQGQGQQQSGTNTTNDSSGSGNKAYAVAYPAVTGTVGNSTGNAGSIFGNLTISNTEKYKQIQEIIQTVNAEMAAGAIDKTTGQTIIDALNTKLLGTVKTQRVLGILWETSGKNLSNLMGFLTWDSFWKDGDAQGGELNDAVAGANSAVTNSDVTTGSTAPATGNGGTLPAGEQK